MREKKVAQTRLDVNYQNYDFLFITLGSLANILKPKIFRYAIPQRSFLFLEIYLKGIGMNMNKYFDMSLWFIPRWQTKRSLDLSASTQS